MSSYFYRIFTSLLCLFVFAISGQSQNVSFTPENFLTDKHGLKQALKAIDEGDRLFNSSFGRHNEAFKKYLIAWEVNPDNVNLNIKTGQSLLYMGNPAESLEYFQRAMTLDVGTDGFVHFLMGLAYHKTGDWARAVDHYNNYRSFAMIMDKTQIADVDKWILQCENAREHEFNKIKVKLKNIDDAVNGKQDEINPIISAEGKTIYFSSNRKHKKNRRKNRNSGRYNYGIFDTQFLYDEWKLSKEIRGKIAGKGSKVILAVSTDQQKMIISRNDGNLYESLRLKSTWSKAKKLPSPINTRHTESSASYSPDASTLYFSSNRPGGMGKQDLWKSQRLDSKKWSEPINLGPLINTEHDEESVFIHSSGDVMFFSNNGPQSTGGFDVFRSIWNDTANTWNPANNMGAPINSGFDENILSVEYSGKTACLSKLSEDGYGGKEVFILSNYADELLRNGKEYIFLEAQVTDIEGKFPEANVTISEYATGKELGNFKTNPHTGRFYAVLEKDVPYAYWVHSHDFFPVFDLINLIHPDPVTFRMRPLSKGGNIIIPDKIITNNENDLSGTGKLVAQGISSLLNDHPTMKLNLSISTGNDSTKATQLIENEIRETLISGGKNQNTRFSVNAIDKSVAEQLSVSVEELNLKVEKFAQHPTIRAMKKAESEMKKRRDPEVEIPQNLKPADKNGDGFISSKEVLGSIDDFFEGELQISAEELLELIDFFFEQ